MLTYAIGASLRSCALCQLGRQLKHDGISNDKLPVAARRDRSGIELHVQH
jgi:hypothetical protein